MGNTTKLDRMARECLALRVRSLNRVITKIYDNALRPLEMKVSQLNILVAAGKMGLARPAQVCRLLHLETSTLSRNVERMKANGWLETVAGADARTQSFRLTDAGRRLLDRTALSWEKAQRKAAKLLSDKGVALLNSTVKLGSE